MAPPALGDHALTKPTTVPGNPGPWRRTFAALAGVTLGSLGALLAACADAPETTGVAAAVAVAPVIYGSDDRLEASELSSTAGAPQAGAHAIALVPWAPRQTTREPQGFDTREGAGAEHDDDGGVDLDDGGTDFDAAGFGYGEGSAGARFRLCPEEPFGQQLSLADCSGVLVAPDLVLTAGHCFEPGDACDRYGYARGLANSMIGAPPAEPVSLHCRELVIREVGTLDDGTQVDYALVRLAAELEGSVASVAAQDGAVQVGDSVLVAGFPIGLPLKIDPAAEVVAVDRTGFSLWSDTYVGSSGSAIYDAEGKLTGILTNGEPDFVWDEQRRCNRSRVVTPGAGDAAEHAMHAWVALARACHRVPELAQCADVLEGDAPVLGQPKLGVPDAQTPPGQPVEKIATADVHGGAPSGSDAGVPAGEPQRNRPRRSWGCALGRPTHPGTAPWLLGCVLAYVWQRRRHARSPSDSGNETTCSIGFRS